MVDFEERGTEDNLYQIPYLTETTTFADWVSHYNTLIVNKLNQEVIYNGVSGNGIVFTLGTTAPNDPVGGETSGPDLASGVFRCSIAEVIPQGITFNDDVTINGELHYDLTRVELPTITKRINPWSSDGVGGTAGTRGFTFGNPVVVNSEGNYQLAQANNACGAEVVGIVSDVVYPSVPPYTDANTYVELTLAGKISGDFSNVIGAHDGLTGGSVYFLSPGISGEITPIEPSIGGHVSKPVMVGVTSDVAYVMNYRGQLLQGSGTGGTGGIDNNQFIVNVAAGTTLARGDVVGYKPGEGHNNEGWFTANVSNNQFIGNSVGLCTTDPYEVDSQEYIQLISSGFVDNIPCGDVEGLLYVGSDGKLTNVYSGEPSKPFAISWSTSGTGVGPYRGIIINQNHNGGGGGNEIAGGGGGGNAIAAGGGGRNWAYRSTSTGVTYGSAVNENLLINGNFDIWQRGIGVDSVYGATGTTYFADKWVRIDGVSGGGGVAGAYTIQRQNFTSNQTEVSGKPQHYVRITNPITLPTNGDFVYIENRIEDVRSLRNEDVTLSFWGRQEDAGESMLGVVVNQYDGSNLYTTFPVVVSLGSLWRKYEVSFTVPNIETTPTGKHYLGIGFDSTISGSYTSGAFNLAMVKLERGLVATTNDSVVVEDELDRCRRYYQRSYSVDQKNATETMFDVTRPDVTVVDFLVTPNKDLYHRFPIPMRDTPNITFYSPKGGYTGDAYNRTANRNLLRCSGTRGYNNEPRIVSVGATTINTDVWNKNGMRVIVAAGGVLFDSISFHYVADADLNDNMPNV